jgi:endonuclease/exonuclease/phosphatase family metal-dependent hydrolase
MTELTVASFNIRNGRAWDGVHSWPFRRGATRRMVQLLGADVLGVQEAYSCQARYLDHALVRHSRHGRGRNQRGGEWCAVYVDDSRFEVPSATTRWYGESPDLPGSRLTDALFPRVVTSVRLVDRADGTRFDVHNTHLDERRPENRKRAVEQLVSWIDPSVPVIVMGDLNAAESGQPSLFRLLERAGLAAALPADAGGTAHDFGGGTGGRRLDHIFVSAHWTVRAAEVVTADVGRLFPSDHWPVRARLSID